MATRDGRVEPEHDLHTRVTVSDGWYKSGTSATAVIQKLVALLDHTHYPDILSRQGKTPMALSIKTAEADNLARNLARLTGETMTEAVTAALRERLARERAKREASASLPVRLAALSEQLRKDYDTRPVSGAEWDAAAGDDT